tara:strand:+ start:3707 stop:4744 length:1038 start_codon:yes stop_codon:yes gene_type:complete
MELYEKEFLLSSVLFGSSVIEIGDGRHIYVHPLTIEKNFFAQRVYKRVYDEALLSGVFTRKERLELIAEEGIWLQEDEDLLEKNKKIIEGKKIDLYENFLRPIQREQIRGQIRDIEREQLVLFTKKHTSDHLDCEGIAQYARWEWIIENTTTHKDGTPYDFEELNISSVLSSHNKQQETDVAQIRQVAREDPWTNIWGVSKDTEQIFNRRPSELSEAQKNLIGWAKLYDAVNEAHEGPSNEVIKDDDALDGWLAKSRKEADKERGKKRLSEKHAGADEVFMMAQSKEEIEEISSLNDPHSNNIKNQRMKRLKNKSDHSGRGLEYHKFSDRKQKAMVEANNAGMSK